MSDSKGGTQGESSNNNSITYRRDPFAPSPRLRSPLHHSVSVTATSLSPPDLQTTSSTSSSNDHQPSTSTISSHGPILESPFIEVGDNGDNNQSRESRQQEDWASSGLDTFNDRQNKYDIRCGRYLQKFTLADMVKLSIHRPEDVDRMKKMLFLFAPSENITGLSGLELKESLIDKFLVQNNEASEELIHDNNQDVSAGQVIFSSLRGQNDQTRWLSVVSGTRRLSIASAPTAQSKFNGKFPFDPVKESWRPATANETSLGRYIGLDEKILAVNDSLRQASVQTSSSSTAPSAQTSSSSATLLSTASSTASVPATRFIHPVPIHFEQHSLQTTTSGSFLTRDDPIEALLRQLHVPTSLPSWLKLRNINTVGDIASIGSDDASIETFLNLKVQNSTSSSSPTLVVQSFQLQSLIKKAFEALEGETTFSLADANPVQVKETVLANHQYSIKVKQSLAQRHLHDETTGNRLVNGLQSQTEFVLPAEAKFRDSILQEESDSLVKRLQHLSDVILLEKLKDVAGTLCFGIQSMPIGDETDLNAKAKCNVKATRRELQVAQDEPVYSWLKFSFREHNKILVPAVQGARNFQDGQSQLSPVALGKWSSSLHKTMKTRDTKILENLVYHNATHRWSETLFNFKIIINDDSSLRLDFDQTSLLRAKAIMLST